jgi:hypothetical protein
MIVQVLWEDELIDNISSKGPIQSHLISIGGEVRNVDSQIYPWGEE